MYFMLKRIPRRPSMFTSALYMFFGGFTGSLLFIPFGIAFSRSSLRRVEDPHHLATALHDTMQEQRRNKIRTNPLSSDAPVAESVDEQSKWSDTPPANNDPSHTLPSRAPTAAASDWSSWSDTPQNSASDNPPTSRWEELRRNRKSEPSKWEQLRQQHARDSLPPNVARKSPSVEDEYNVQSDYDRAMKEYRAALERERQGIDVTTGFTERDDRLRS